MANPAVTATCSRCGRAVPACNLTIHESRCSPVSRPRLATNVAKGGAAPALAPGADDAGGIAGGLPAEAAAPSEACGGDDAGRGAPRGPPADEGVAGGGPGLERREEEGLADASAPCPDCGGPLEWSDYSQGQYRGGWGCNACSASSSGGARMWPFAMMAMGGDMLVRLLALLIYVGVVMPDIKKIKFDLMLQALRETYPDSKPKWHQIFKSMGDWLASGNKCRRQEITLGIRGTMLELGLLGFVWMLLFFCGYPCNKRRQEADDEALLQQMQQQGQQSQQGVELASMQAPVMVSMQPPMGQQSFGVGTPACNQVVGVGMPGGDFGLGSQAQGFGY